MIRKIFTIFICLMTSSCIFLSRSAIINPDNLEAVTLVSIEIIYDGKQEKRDSGFVGHCQLRFHDLEFNSVRYRREKNSKFFFLKSDSPKIYLDTLNCMHNIVPLFYLKNRKIDVSRYAFVTHEDYINYAGHIVINYKPRPFSLIDLFGLGGASFDEKGKFTVRIEDRIDDAIRFIEKEYPELASKPINKALIQDIADIKPNQKPNPYTPPKAEVETEKKPAAQLNQTEQKNQNSPAPTKTFDAEYHPQPSESYQMQPATMPYQNPYQVQGPQIINPQILVPVN